MDLQEVDRKLNDSKWENNLNLLDKVCDCDKVQVYERVKELARCVEQQVAAQLVDWSRLRWWRCH